MANSMAMTKKNTFQPLTSLVILCAQLHPYAALHWIQENKHMTSYMY